MIDPRSSHDDGSRALGPRRRSLELEKIPYRRIARLPRDERALLVVAGAELDAAEIAVVDRARRRWCSAAATLFARQVFGATRRAPKTAAARSRSTQPVWPSGAVALARLHGKRDAARCRVAPFCDTTELTQRRRRSRRCCAEPGPRRSAGGRAPQSLHLVARRPRHRVREPDARGRRRARRAARPRAPGTSRRAVPRRRVYYAAPTALRALGAAPRPTRRLDRRLAALGERASEYPIDATGWLLVELVKHLIELAAGSLVRVARWPAPYQAAAS